MPAKQNGNLPYKQYFAGIYHSYTYTSNRIGPFYGRVLGVGQDAANPNNLYAMTFGSGMYKSTNAGVSWVSSSLGISYLYLQAMAVDPVTPNTVYVGTYGDDSVPYDGVFKTTDGGATWKPTGEMANVWNGVRYHDPVVYALAVDRLNPQRVFAGTRMKFLPNGSLGGGGVFRTENGGGTWTPVNSGLPNEDLYIYDLALDPSQPGRVYAALHQHGLYRSDDYGGSWYPLGGTPYAGRAVAVDPFSSSTLYFGAVKKLGLHRSYDSGGTWSQIGGVGWDSMVGAISPDPLHPGVLYAGILVDNTNNYIIRSTDRGNSWNVVANLNTWGRMVFSPDGQMNLIGVDSNGTYRSMDEGLTWRRSSSGLSGYSVTGLVVSPTVPTMMHASLYGFGVFTSVNRGVSWSQTTAGLGNPGVLALAADPSNEAVLYATTDQSAVYRSIDGGTTWGALSVGYPPAAAPSGILPASPFENRPPPQRDDLIEDPQALTLLSPTAATGLAAGNTIVVSPVNPNIVLVGTAGRGVYRLIDSAWAPSSLSTGTVYNILFDRANAGRALAATSAGVMVSANNGQTWQASNSGLAGRTVDSLAQSLNNPSIFLAGSDSGVYQSTDGGSTWSKQGLPGKAVKAVGVLSIDDDVFFAGTDSTAYYYDSVRGTWNSLQIPFNNVSIQGILPEPSEKAVYFITRLGGTIRVDVK